MRAIGLSDLDVAARALLAQPREDWKTLADKLLTDAHMADLWRKRHGVAHPGGGTGSLYAQAALQARVDMCDCSRDYCAAMIVLLRAIEDWRGRSHRVE